MQLLGIFFAGALLGGLFGYAGGLDAGRQLAYDHCVENQAQSKLLLDAKSYCAHLTRAEMRR